MKFSLAAALALALAVVQPAAAQTVATPRFPGAVSLSYQDIQTLVNGDHQGRSLFWEAITHYDRSVEILATIKSVAPDVYNKHNNARNAMRSAFELVKLADDSVKA